MERRRKFEPVSRILGNREFYGRTFRVTPDVLDPRADTETLIGAALALAQGREPAHSRPRHGFRGHRGDLAGRIAGSQRRCHRSFGRGLAGCEDNARALGVAERISFVQANWFEGVEGKFDLIVSNPPYIPLGDIAGLAPDVRAFDPQRALDGGPDGLEAYRRIASGVESHLAAGGRILLEIGAGQESMVNDLFREQGFVLESRHFDLGGHVRCLVFNRP